MRIDKFLWCFRAFKTRSKATEACRKGHIKLNDEIAKASAIIKVGDELAYRLPPIWKCYQVVDIPKSRVGAKLVPDLVKETTPFEALEQLDLIRAAQKHNRPAGAGRPTKRERREIDRLKGL